ncbi:MAG: glycosyltransferase family 2 protein [Chitinophagaceae bacterium]|nr:glycosyltransferase family 2 protein [Chitinophagaceae bacterium]
MKVSGFSFIKDAIKYDYPAVEAIRSILPLCDEVVVAVGKSSDQTLQLIQSIDPNKIRIVETIWDESKREGGQVLALETDKAYEEINSNTDWAFYIQGDEVVHEKYYPVIREAMQTYKDDDEVDGLLFHYLHFYGSYDYVAAASNFYKKEIRVVRKRPGIYSYRDAQGFRKNGNQKLRVVQIEAYIYHYGWVRKPEAMQAKVTNFHKYWHDDTWIEDHVLKANEFDYSAIDQLSKFQGTHPQIMQARIDQQNWTFDYDLSHNKFSIKELIKNVLFKLFKIDLNYKNYELLKRGVK